MVGRMVRGYPSIVRRIYNEGHTVANHSQNHPFTFHKMTVEQASVEIEDGFESLRSVLGDPKAVAPFFRIPGLLRQTSVEQYLASRDVMTWSVDFLADDWTHISASEVAKRAISRMEAHRKGILLLHDIQPATALAFPEILSELKARGLQDRARRAGDARSAEDRHDAGPVGRRARRRSRRSGRAWSPSTRRRCRMPSRSLPCRAPRASGSPRRWRP